MKTSRCVPRGLLLALAVLLSCEAAAQTTVSFPDSNLESAVQLALGKTNLLTAVDMLGLTNLTSWTFVTNLSGLEYATNLESFRLYNGAPASLSPLSGLVQLRTLSLERTPAQNLSGLSNLTQLTNLDLFLSSLTNASLVAPLTNLVYLDVSWNLISDPGLLTGLPYLNYLDLSGNPLSNSAVLAGLTNLSGWLYLDSASLTNTDGLGGLKNLTGLSLYQNPVTQLGSVSNLTRLMVLDLGDDPVRDVSPLAGLTNLETLFLEGTAISNLDGLPLLPRLTTLDVNDDRLPNLNALAAFTNLQWLNLSYNHLTNIDTLANLSQLAKVYLQLNSLNTNAGSASFNVIQALVNRGVDVKYLPQHGPPMVGLPDHWLIAARDTSSQWFSVSDDLTAGEQLVIGVQSSNTGLVSAVISPNPLSPFPSAFGDAVEIPPYVSVPNAPQIPGWSGYLNLFPVPTQTGTATITVTATDETGLTTDAMLALTVGQPLPFDGSAVGISNSNMSWTTFGAEPWQAETNVVHSDGRSAQSGSEDSWLETNVTGPGLLTFWWRYFDTNWSTGAELTATCSQSGLTGHAWLLPRVFTPSGPLMIDWQKTTLSLPSGAWILRWQYSQPSFNSSPIVWLADVSFTPGPPVCWLEPEAKENSGKYLSLRLHGAPGETYDVQSSFDLRQWSRLDRLTLSDFQGRYFDSNATNAARFYRLSKPTLAPIWFERPSLDGSNLIQLTVHSESGQPLSIQSSTNLLNWTTLLQTNNTAGLMRIAGGAAGDLNLRFYRAKALPWGGQSLLPVAPAPGLFFNPRRHPFAGLSPPALPGLPPLPQPVF